MASKSSAVSVSPPCDPSQSYIAPKWSLLREDGVGIKAKSSNNQSLLAVNASLNPRTREYYTSMLETLRDSGVPFLVGGAYALAAYTGIERRTKDLDLFCKREDFDAILEILQRCGCTCNLIYPHWLGKAFNGDDFIDIIFNSGNGKSPVDDSWFEGAPECEVLGITGVKLVRPEEVIWSKAFICERERYDGGDVAHIFRVQGPKIDWRRMLDRFSIDHDWRVLFAHVTFFGYIYPDAQLEGECIPDWVFDYFTEKMEQEREDMKKLRDSKKHRSSSVSKDNQPLIEKIERKVCCGPLLSREQYLVDISRWGYRDARSTVEGGPMKPSEIALWTAAIDFSSR
jgi:hypothetical protein